MESSTTVHRPEAAGGTGPNLAKSPLYALERSPFALLVDRWLPARAVPFLIVVAAISAAFWIGGFALAADKRRFLESRDWQVQPLFFASHFVILRMFVTSYSKGFLSGCRRLTIEHADAERRIRRALALACVAAPVLAAWFAISDLMYLFSPDYVEAGESQGAGGAFGAADWLTGVIWTTEWIINAYVWAVILAFLALTMQVLKKFPFRSEVEVVLGERHYRSFLMMSAQGATIVLLFSIVYAFYVWRLAQPEATDYLGLWVTAGLLILCFVPPWLRLKGGIARSARAEADRLNREVHEGWKTIESSAAQAATPEGIAARLTQLLALARAGHLERLVRDLGRNEGQAMLIRLLAPLSTVVWKVFRPG